MMHWAKLAWEKEVKTMLDDSVEVRRVGNWQELMSTNDRCVFYYNMVRMPRLLPLSVFSCPSLSGGCRRDCYRCLVCNRGCVCT